jgi:ankyrin repeat protein
MNGRSLLHYAADAGNFDILKELINNGANVNVNNLNRTVSLDLTKSFFFTFQSKDKFGLTPLLAAIYEDHTDCVKYLLEQVSIYIFFFILENALF